LKEEIATCVGWLFEQGLTSALDGNVSARVAELIYVSPTNVPRYRVKAADVSVVTRRGDHLEGKPPSTELPTHLAIYNDTDSAAVVHTHSRFATALACLRRDLRPPDVEGERFLGLIPLIPYAPPGSSELAEAVSTGIKGFRGGLLENHGLIAIGEDPEEACIVAESIERAARLVFDLHLIGRQ